MENAKQFYSVSRKQVGSHDVLISVVAGFKDETGYVYCSEKRTFRNDEPAALAFAQAPRELRSKVQTGHERETTARHNNPVTKYYMVEKKAEKK